MPQFDPEGSARSRQRGALRIAFVVPTMMKQIIDEPAFATTESFEPHQSRIRRRADAVR